MNFEYEQDKQTLLNATFGIASDHLLLSMTRLTRRTRPGWAAGKKAAAFLIRIIRDQAH